MTQNLDALVCAASLHGPANVCIANPFAHRTPPIPLQGAGVQAGVASALASILSQLAVAIFLIDQAGCIVLANAAAQSLVLAGDGLRATNQRLRVCDLRADQALRRAINRALSHDQDGPRATEAVAPRRGRHPLLLSIVPLCGDGGDVSPRHAGAAAMAVVMDPEAQVWSHLDGVAQAYGLTAAESRLLAAIIEGDGVDVAARRLGITRSTAKTHLQHIFAKTFTSRQSELVRLVASTVPPLRHAAPPLSLVHSRQAASPAA